MFHIPNIYFLQKFLYNSFMEVHTGHLVTRLIKKVFWFTIRQIDPWQSISDKQNYSEKTFATNLFPYFLALSAFVTFLWILTYPMVFLKLQFPIHVFVKKYMILSESISFEIKNITHASVRLGIKASFHSDCVAPRQNEMDRKLAKTQMVEDAQ